MSVTDRTIRRVVWRRPSAAAAERAGIRPSLEPLRRAARRGAPRRSTSPPTIRWSRYFQNATGAVDLGNLDLDSPALAEMRAAGVTLVVPLVANGELVGLLNVGPRLSDQDYSADDRRLLETLAAQAAPAVRVGQLVREQQAEIRARDRLEQELAVAQLIQQNFLPKELPELAGWEVAAFYRPARAVGGDFYDFIELADGRIGLVIGDVTDKGVPAAMVMAATRSVLRASAQRLHEPGAVLARVNDSLCPDIPENMFVTCFYGVLDPGDRASALRERRPQPAARRNADGELGAARDRHAARPDARDELRGARGDARARRVRAALQRRADRGARRRARDVRERPRRRLARRPGSTRRR